MPVLQGVYFVAHLAADILYRHHRVVYGEAAELGNAVEVGNREFAVYAAAVMPYRPDEEREYRFAEELHVFLEVKEAVVVERHHHADVVQRRGVTLVALYGVGIGMEHVRVVYYRPGCGRGAFYQIVVVGVHTRYHAPSHAVRQEIHQHGLLASLQLGSVESNSDLGIFGTLDEETYEQFTSEDTLYTAGFKQEVTEGPAQIISCLNGRSTSYSIEITSVNFEAADTNRGITFRVTDQSLIDETGGIVQGMSGSPIIQNGKLIGAVTHVFVNDPAKGYGIFIETMLNADR